MPSFVRFRADARASAVPSICVTAGVIALAALAATHFMDHAVKDGSLQRLARGESDLDQRFARATALLRSDGRGESAQGTFDGAPTASIPSATQPILLDPCTGARK